MKIEARPAVLIMLIIFSTIMLLSMLTSCTGCSESGRRSVATQSILKAEKVVIIDAATPKYDNDVPVTWYKVKRIEYGVNDYIRIVGAGLYESGDTIFYKYPTR